MTAFSPEWLSAREPVDHAARNQQVLSEVISWLERNKCDSVADIASGAGSTIRAMTPEADFPINWHLFDNDSALLKQALRLAEDPVAVKTSTLNLMTDWQQVLAQSPDLITTSAFFDLVSRDWLEAFVKDVTQAPIPVYAALTYDGRASCKPVDAQDEEVIEAVNRHQLGDKGFGPALGPQAAETAIQLFEDAGYRVVQGQSDWHASNAHKDFQRMLLAGWCEAATQLKPERSAAYKQWLARRVSEIDAGNLSVTVGHVDFFAWPQG